MQATWAQGNDFHDNHFIELEFPTEIFVQEINIYETYHAGAVVRIKLKNKLTNEWKTVWESSIGPLNIETSRVFSPELLKVYFKTNQVRLELDCTVAHTYCEIDAVELVGKKYYVDNVETETSLSKDMARILKTEEFSDIEFEVEGKILKAHRNVMISRSSYFKGMLCENLKQDRLNKPIHIDNISYVGFRALLFYLYTGNIEDDLVCEIVCELMRISKWYDLEDLNQKGYEYIQGKLSIDNILDIYICSSTIEPKLDDVENVCLKFIAKNFYQLHERPAFKSLPVNILIAITQFYAQFQK